MKIPTKAVGVVVLFAMLSGLVGVAPIYSEPGVLYVAVGGTDTGDCTDEMLPCGSITYAIGVAGEGSTIIIAAGHYIENLEIADTALTLRGGYTNDQGQWLPDNGETIIDGGGVNRTVFAHGSQLQLENLTIVGGRAPEESCWGGGVSATDSVVAIRRSVIAHNVAHCTSGQSGGGAGGGVDANADWGAVSMTIEDSIIHDNFAFDHGGGVNTSYAELHLTNVLIMNNSTDGQANAAMLYEGQTTMVNCTVADNNPEGQSGILVQGSGTLAVSNSILWNNSLNLQVEGECAECVQVSYSDLGGGWPGDGNIDGDPAFADPGNGDYRLTRTSPCIDAGTDAGAPDHDLDGRHRPLDGNDDGTAVTDMGAYEFPQVCASWHGVDDMRGRWEFLASLGDGDPAGFDLYINDLGPDPASATGNDYLATGCMASPGAEGMTPLLMKVEDLCDGSFDLSLLSTAVPPPGAGDPFVIQFLGAVLTHGSGVPDDEAGGQVRTDFTEGTFTGTHYDRRRTKCPPVGDIPIPGLYFYGDVYVHHGFWGDQIEHRNTLLEGFTNIVSLGMRVEWPDGTVVVVPFYTDIFSPFVDFVSEFRYLEGYEGDPASGEPYSFTLLDGLGNPIPGTTVTDVWTECLTYPPPRALDPVMDGMNIDLYWTNVPDALGFDPDDSEGNGQLGFYQLGASPLFGGGTDYGASGITIPNHILPWVRHADWDEGGFPDGFDHGFPLGELEDGFYQLQVEAFSAPNPANPGFGHECAVWDLAENLFFDKTADGITFVTLGSISGQVTDGEGKPLPDVAVDIEQGGFGACTDENGYYAMRGLPLDTYNVVAGRDFCGPEPYVEQMVSGVTLTEGSPDATGVDFVLAPAGSISGQVADEGGNPLPDIAVDIEQGGFGTCTDENGYYTVRGLPFGTYNVVAGRDFCGEHPYEEVMAVGIVLSEAGPDVDGINFVLKIAY